MWQGVHEHEYNDFQCTSSKCCLWLEQEDGVVTFHWTGPIQYQHFLFFSVQMTWIVYNFMGKKRHSEVLSEKKKKVGPSLECSQAYRLYFSTCIYRRRGFGIVSVITARFSNSAMWRGAHQPLIYGGWRVCAVCMWVFACMAYLCGVFTRVPSYCLKHAQLFHCSLPCSLQELWYCMILL